MVPNGAAALLTGASTKNNVANATANRMDLEKPARISLPQFKV
ncbi:MAG: hypothetical protein V1767_03190 [Chloroflexota bacterium]